MSYSVRISPAAERQLDKLEPILRNRILETIKFLGEQPRPGGVKKLTGPLRGLYRVKAGPGKTYRIIYDIQDSVLIIVIVSVADRKDAYR